MKNLFIFPVMAMVVMVCLVAEGLRVPLHDQYHASIDGKATKTRYEDIGQKLQHDEEEGVKQKLGMDLYPTGSSLPDCSHACGPCFPCKRVMVSFKCSTAESCPIVYRCMCKGKYYHVPSN